MKSPRSNDSAARWFSSSTMTLISKSLIDEICRWLSLFFGKKWQVHKFRKCWTKSTICCEQLGVTDDVDEQHVTNLEFQIRNLFDGHNDALQGFGAGKATIFSKRGSYRSGSNIGSSRSSAGVSGTPTARGPVYGIVSSFCKAAMARSASPVCAA